LKVKVRKAYNRSKLREHHLEELKRLSMQLLANKKKRTRDFLDKCKTKKVYARMSSTST